MIILAYVKNTGQKQNVFARDSHVSSMNNEEITYLPESSICIYRGIDYVYHVKISSRKAHTMASNTGEGYRKGSVNDRTQVHNPKTNTWVKRDTETGKFMDGKSDGTPFKGVAREPDKRRS